MIQYDVFMFLSVAKVVKYGKHVLPIHKDKIREGLVHGYMKNKE